MLVHKQSMGILTEYWTGKFYKSTKTSNTQIPVLEKYTPEDILNFDPSEWWDVSAKTTIGRKILRYYPFCDPVISDDGELLDVIPWPSWKIYGEPEPEEIPVMDKPKPKQRRRRRLL